MYAIFRSKKGTFSVAFSAAWSYISYILDVQSFTSLAHKWFRDDIREKLWIQFSGNLLMKLAGSTWGASANTLWSSALALCYSAAEYCAPVWSRSAHTSRVDVQLNSTMRLISGTLRSTPSSALQHWTASPTKEGCHWQAGGENRQTWQLANAAWYT